MSRNSIENSLIRYLTGQASENDVESLSEWIKDDENQKMFHDYVKIHFEISTVLQNEEIAPLKDRLMSKISENKKKNSKKITTKRILSYAALVIVFITGGYFSATQLLLPLINNTEQNIQEKFVILETEEGDLIKLQPTKEKVITNAQGNSIGNQKGEKLIYLNDAHVADPSYVTIRIPYGKKFNIVLADGTSIYLNSGSTLRYPTFFKKDIPRSVTLTGEAFFEVAEDKTHPFIVESDAIKIKVLGTKFNVNNYAENQNIHTVLVEGSVSLLNPKNSDEILLKPNQKADWNRKDNTINVEDVDSYRYTAWMDGKLIFRNAKFNKISRALERKYNVKIEIENKELEKEIFDASFDIESIREVLESFKRSYSFEYKIDKNHITIY
ncbi:FecR family protein [Leeuwenhoekiella aestuarii]|uniref:FecR family protein n=1 Tax=Leeuwenhoekiella aestuarii TaxID=2249426 RepID=A0A4Q0NRR8_9FLAO|nr:FecR family protein [Leeuwenhoekiella aestuarii]RXG13336.1 FecR family protein [Leeuwenhoekiella aestuarii]RXG14933.1 FecR family protein [Leeuwenhoekiella aestuarii]